MGCDQMVAREDLRSVVVVPQPDHCTGATVEMRLMKRDRERLIAVPGSNRRFIKMFSASAGEVGANILARERRELEEQWVKEGSQPEGCFIQEALALLAKRDEANTLKASMSFPKEKQQQGQEEVKDLVDEMKQSESKNTNDELKVMVDPFAEEDEGKATDNSSDADSENNENQKTLEENGNTEKQIKTSAEDKDPIDDGRA